MSKGCVSKTNPVVHYQNQQRIWNSVRIDSAQYVMNKASLTSYEPWLWNQQSDRTYPHVQNATVPSHGNSTKRTLTRARPGASTPGGVGCDIKFNSYARYLNRLKGKSDLRRGNAAAPINMRGGKYYKTNIIPSCYCPGPMSNIFQVVTQEETQPTETQIETQYVFNIGELITWDCNYGIVLDHLPKGYLLVQGIDKYGDETTIDIINAKNIKKMNSCFKEKDVLLNAQNYFENSLNSMDSICFQ